jgi:thiol-disulfide isomerase/thioredoxin
LYISTLFKKMKMKKTITLAALALLVACQEEAPKDFVTFSGKITNNTADSIKVVNRNYSKTIAVAKDGTFKDTLKIADGVYYFDTGDEATPLYLKNGFEIDMAVDIKEFDETVVYTGNGSQNSTYLASKTLFEETLFEEDFGSLNMAELEAKIGDMTTEMTGFIDSQKGIDPDLITNEKENLTGMMESFKSYYGEMIALRVDMPKGSPSPTFEDFENIDGSKTSLADLKGQNVYIDIWATWCAPCKAEIPALKQLEKDYHGKDIAFVSMSIDDDRSHGGSWDKAKEDWQAMVKDMELGGIQIYAPKGWKTKFVEDYRIKGIPRFILIDKDGNIVDPSAPRPSDDGIRAAIDALI